MALRTLRRLYIFVAAFIGLQIMAAGLIELLTLLGERLLGGAPYAAAGVAALRLGSSVALVLVGLALWAGHWALAQRNVSQPEEQRAALRRLYAYAVLLVAALTAMFALQEGLAVALEQLGQGPAPLALIRPLATAVVSGLVWLAHWRLFSADRPVVERSGPNATLRRWYLALVLWVSLALASFGAGVLIHELLQRFAFGAALLPRQLAVPAAALISGLAVWLPHEVWSRRLIRAPGPLQADELDATLRQVYTALVLTASLVAALTGLTALLAAGLRAALGAATWAGAFTEETRAVAAVVVALPLLGYYREQLVATAQISTVAERSGTARRLVSYLTAAVSLVALYVGLGGVIGTLLRLGLGGGTIGAGWRTPLSWYAAIAIVALPVYALVSWRSEGRARASADEERVLSRRIYLYGALLFGIVATVAMVIPLIEQLIVALLGQAEPGAAGEIGRLAGYTVLGAAVSAAYGFLLRRAGAARGTAGAGRTIVLVADASMGQALAAAFAHELPGASLAVFDERDTPERRTAVGAADMLVISLAALGDVSLSGFGGPRLLLATPVEGYTLGGGRRGAAATAREAARTARALCRAERPAVQPPLISAPGAGAT